jgi:serine/threonine protein kinase
MALTSGTKLGPYQIQSSLGAGGMGEVYRAVDTRLARIVAIKILPESFAKDADRLRRFKHEAELLSALNHPNLLTIFDVGSQDGIEYLVSEFLEGQTLRECLRHGALPQRRVIDYAMQTANGLSAAHDKGIVHRDLKPENIFVTRGERVKILDFGLAKQTSVTQEAVELATLTGPMPTASGMILGTVGYMSPEQVRAQAADYRSDIFSFGAILYELLSGKRAFRGDSGIETMNAILNTEPAELSESGLPVNPGLERIVRRCLDKSPERRFQSASDLSFALEGLSGPFAKVVPAHSKNRSALVFALVVGVIIATGVYLFRLKPRPANGQDWTADMMAGPPVSMDPRISPDGHTLAFQAMIENVTQVAVSNPDTGNWTVLTHDHEHGFVNEIANRTCPYITSTGS